MTEYMCLYSNPCITWLTDNPAMQDYFMDPVTGEGNGPVFPPNFEKIKPFLKEMQIKIMTRMNFLKEEVIKRASENAFKQMLEAFKDQMQISAVFVLVEVRNWGNAK